jgi:hypothetical protein
MAQELIDKIRAAAQAKGIDPDVAVRIARAESSLKPEVGAKTSTAGGLFGVIDSTWKGFGGAPGKKFDPDENIRVGTDVISSNTQALKKFLNRDPRPAEIYAAHYFGPAGAKSFLSADPATPIVDILGQKAVKANPNLQGKTVSQVMAQLETKMGGPKQPDVSRETSAPTRQPLPPSLPPMAAAEDSSAAPSKLAELGPGYQAALALSFLADTDDKEDRDIDREPGIAEKWLAQQSTRPAALGEFADISIKSPFAPLQPQPQMLADGGTVQHLAGGGLPFIPTARVRQSAKQELDSMKAQSDRYNTEVEAYNKAAEAWNAGPREQDFTMAEPVAPNITQEMFDAKAQAARRDAQNRNLALQVAADPARFGLTSMNKFFADGGEVERLTPQQIERLAEKNVKLTGINKVIDFVAQRVDPQTKGLPTSARTLLETVQGGRSRITEANFSPEEIDVMRQLATLKGGDKGSINYADYVALAGEMNKQGKVPASMSPSLFSMADPMGNVQTTLGQFRYQRDPKGNLQIIDTYDFNPPNPNAMQEARTGDYGAFGPYGLIRDYAGERIPPGMGRDVRINLPPVKRADGGVAEPTPEEIEAASRPATVNPNIQRQGEAARRLAAMRDVNTLPDPRTYAAVSGFFGQAPDEMGFSVMHPDAQGIKRAGQAGFGVGTALAVAPVAGKAAQMLGKMTGSAMNERMLAGQSLTPGINTPAPINFAVKPRGGHFAVEGKTYGGPREQGQRFAQADPDGGRVEVIQNYVNTYLANTNDQLLNEWMQNKVAPYMRRDMGTEMDQFVKAADEGRKLHFINKPITEGYAGPHMPGWMRSLRKTEGFPEEGFAKTPYGQDVEMITDRVPSPVALDEAYESSIPAGLKQFVKTDPNMRMYELNFHGLDALNLIELRDKMARMRQMSPEFSKYGQPGVKIPEQYMFTDKSLQGLTPAQASERVAQFDTWKEQAQQKMASRAAFVDPAISRTKAADGYVWVNPPDLERNPALRELIQDVGCDGGWCTKGENYALSYGSGENRLTVLMDSKARPRAQMTIKSAEPNSDDFLLSMDDAEAAQFKAAYPDMPIYDTKAIMRTPEYQEWLARNPPSMSITEIKGVNNQATLEDAPYLKQIQQRVKDLDARFGLESVDNLGGIGMTQFSKNPMELLNMGVGFNSRKPLTEKFGSEQAGLAAVRDEVIKLNNGSQYTAGNLDDVAALVRQATSNVLAPQQRATGGMIERQSTDTRKYL